MASTHGSGGTVRPFPTTAEQSSAIGCAFSQLQHGVLVFGPDHKLLASNAAARTLLLLHGNALRLGMTWDEVIKYCSDRGDFELDHLAAKHRKWPTFEAGCSNLGFNWIVENKQLQGSCNGLSDGGAIIEVFDPNLPVADSSIGGNEHGSRDIAWTSDNTADADPAHLLSLAEDLMSARKQAETASYNAEESQARVEAIVETVVDAIITTDEAGTIKTFNRAAEQIFGYEPNEIINKNLAALFVPHGLDARADLFADDVAAKIQAVLGRPTDETGLTKNGIVFPVRFTVTEMELGVQRMLNWVIRDVTEDRQTREALQQKSDLIHLLHTVTEAASDAESIADPVKVCLKAVCAHINWPVGHAYGCGDEMAIGNIWHIADPGQTDQFKELTSPTAVGEPARLIDHTPDTGEGTWFFDTESGMSGPLAATARAAGIRSGFAIPVVADGKVAVVLEFFTTELVGPEQSTLQALNQVGSQLGRAIERKRSDETILRMALRDSLTGIANREQFHRQLQAALAAALRMGRPVALLMLDVDNFKDVNDTLGHPIGDQLLREVSRRLSACCRETDTVARLGGDEFAVIATHLQSPEAAAYLARRMIRALREPVKLDGRDVHITGSIGVTLYPTDGLDPADLQKNADLALYRAKDGGKNRFQFYNEEMHDSVLRRKTMERDLRAAIEAGAFELHYQPQIDLKTMSVIGADALIRWPHPKDGLVSPLDFIPLAEATGLIVPLGEWVLATACRQIAEWRQRGLYLPRVSVNMSGVQLNKSPITETVEKTIRDAGITPNDLELELTESTVMEKVEAVIPVLQHFHDLGITIAVDDFGTGYSSLSYLKRLPVDKLKIDRSFVSDVTENEDDAAIAQAITSLAKTLRLQAVAEGIETKDQLLFLQQIGCHAAQGYYLSRPLTVDAFAGWLRDSQSTLDKL